MKTKISPAKRIKEYFAMVMTSRRVSGAVTINKTVYFFQKLPVIGKKIPNSLYGNAAGKTVFFVLANIIRLNKRLIIKGAYIAILFGLSFFALEIQSGSASSLDIHALMNLFFFLSFIAAPLAFAKSLNLDISSDMLMIDRLRVDPDIYIPARIYERKIIDMAVSVLPVILLSLHKSFTLMQALIILPMVFMAKMVGEAIVLLSFSLLNKITTHAYKILSFFFLFLGGAVIIAAMVLTSSGIYMPFREIVLHPLNIFILTVAAFASGVYISKYSHFRDLAWNTVVNYDLAIQKREPAKKQQLFGNVFSWNKDLKSEDIQSDRFSGLSGYNYFNSIFFYRHKKFFRKKILIRVLIVAGAVIGMVTLLLLRPEEADESATRNFILPMTFFFAYLLSLGRHATAAMFTSCDLAMLTYPFYREPEPVIKNFRLRFKKILLYNVPAFSLLAVLAVTADIFGSFISGGSPETIVWTLLIPYIITMITICIFFSFHDLFIYYILQPYNSEMGTKSKAFSVIQFVVYLLSYINVMLKNVDIYLYMAIIILFTLLYVTSGLLAINKFCAKTFRLR